VPQPPRALGNAQPSFALPLLSVLVQIGVVLCGFAPSLPGIHRPQRQIRTTAACALRFQPPQYASERLALAQMGSNLDHILSQVVETHDNYANGSFHF